MLIDFHTHCFPDKVAATAIPMLAEKAKLVPYSDGTVADSEAKYNEWNVDKAVVLNIATNPRQQIKLNDFAISLLSNPKLIPFGSVHPDAEEMTMELARLKAAGIKGIKLHPEYQDFYVSDEKICKIYEKCVDLDLIITFHAGYDLGFPNSDRASPKNLGKAAAMYPKLKLVCAHMGGFMRWDEVEEYLSGYDNVYFDTSFIVNYLSKEQALRIIRTNIERILFGSDLPWNSSKMTYEYIESLGLSEDEKKKIYYENAVKLLKI